MAKTITKKSKILFGKKKAGKAKKHRNKKDSYKPKVGQGR